MTGINTRPITALLVVMALSGLVSMTGCTQSRSDVFFPQKYNLKNAGNAYVQLGYKYMERGDREAALHNIMRALEIDGNNPEALDAMALFYQRDGEFNKADQYFRKAISADSAYTGGHLNYGQFLYSQKRYDEACEQFRTASDDALYDHRAGAFANLGTCYRALGQSEKAEAAFNDALRIDSKNEAALLELADLYFEQKKYPASIRNIDMYDEVAKPSAQSLWLGIRLQRVFGNADKEASLALQLKNMFPKSEEYLHYMESR